MYSLLERESTSKSRKNKAIFFLYGQGEMVEGHSFHDKLNIVPLQHPEGLLLPSHWETAFP
jgi:hypothetical protein